MFLHKNYNVHSVMDTRSARSRHRGRKGVPRGGCLCRGAAGPTLAPPHTLSGGSSRRWCAWT